MQKNERNAFVEQGRDAHWPCNKKVHMMGIGGSGMSSLAIFLHERGAVVSGSDQGSPPLLKRLGDRGIRIVPAGAEMRESPPDLLVHSAAVDRSTLSSYAAKGTETLKYAAMLSRVMHPFTKVAVAGTHGKTSVSALCAWLLKAAGWSPSYVIGGDVPDLQGGGGCGRGEYFVAEACEFDRSFLNLQPDWAIVTNLESDHLDYYGTFEALCTAFEEFTEKLSLRGGRLIVWDETFPILGPDRFSGLTTWTYGFSASADLRITEYEPTLENAGFRLSLHGKDLGRFALMSPGRHNVLNACAACLMALKMGMDPEQVKEHLPRFSGVRRRLEDRGIHGGVRIFSDYAHHPSEIRVVLEALRDIYPSSRLVVAYQGHQMWRTGYFMEEFGQVLSDFDLVLILQTFSVREKDTQGLPDGKALARKVELCGGRSEFMGDLEEAASSIMPHLKEGDVLILMGAGSVDELSGIIEQSLSIA